MNRIPPLSAALFLLTISITSGNAESISRQKAARNTEGAQIAHKKNVRKNSTADNRLRPWAVASGWLVWELTSLYIGQEILLVSPVSVLRRLWSSSRGGSPKAALDFWASIAFSFFRIIGGFLLASLSGTLLAACPAHFVPSGICLRPPCPPSRRFPLLPLSSWY